MRPPAFAAGTNRNSAPAGSCSWMRSCLTRAIHPIWRHTRGGIVVHEFVCDAHLAEAVERYGYRFDEPPSGRRST